MKKKLDLHKIMLRLTGILVLFIILNIVFLFTGYPFGRILAYSHLKSYMANVYPSYEKISFPKLVTFPSIGCYTSDAIVNNEEYGFGYVLFRSDILDRRLEVYYNQIFLQEFNNKKELLEQKYEIKFCNTPYMPHIRTYVKVGSDYNPDYSKMNTINYLDFSLADNSDHLKGNSKEKSKERFAKIAGGVFTELSENIKFTKIKCNYRDNNGNLYSIVVKGNDYNWEKLLKLIE